MTMTEPSLHLYRYGAKVNKVYDADTITVDIDLGFGMLMRDREIRLWGINAPEVKGVSRPEGLVARDVVRELVLDKWVIIRTELDRTEKFGRLLGYVFAPTPEGYVLVNKLLVDRGLAPMNTYGDTFAGWPDLVAS